MNCIVKWYLMHKWKGLIIEVPKLFLMKVYGCTGKFWDRHDRFFSNIAREFSQASHCALNFSQVWLSPYIIKISLFRPSTPTIKWSIKCIRYKFIENFWLTTYKNHLMTSKNVLWWPWVEYRFLKWAFKITSQEHENIEKLISFELYWF